MTVGNHVPNLSNEVLARVPREASVRNTSPPACEIRRSNVCMCVQMVRYGDFAVLEWGCDEANMEREIWRGG